MTPTLHDSQGREIRNLRLSVTDRCNFRCRYCMPAEGLPWLPRDAVLSFEEIERLARAFVNTGISRLRLTGGEPLLRRELHRLVEKLATLSGVRDLSLTTNGYLLAEQAADLKAAGLRRVNVSLDALTRETFQEIVRRDALEQTMRGLEAAAEHFDGPVKINAVLLRGRNDHEIPAFARLARERGFEVRFIEFMPLEADDSWRRETLVPGSEVVERVSELFPLDIDPARPKHAPSRDYVFRDGAPGKIGCIDSVTHPFCDHCNRIRITAEGKLRTCLFSTTETDLGRMLREGEGSPEAVDQAIEAMIRSAVWKKEPGHKIGDPEFQRASRSMSQIGG